MSEAEAGSGGGNLAACQADYVRLVPCVTGEVNQFAHVGRPLWMLREGWAVQFGCTSPLLALVGPRCPFQPSSFCLGGREAQPPPWSTGPRRWRPRPASGSGRERTALGLAARPR